MQLAGKRPLFSRDLKALYLFASYFPPTYPSACQPLFARRVSSSVAILLASILIAPVPYFSTQSTTVSLRPVSASISGFLTTIIGSCAGFNAVPHPPHFFASSVAGAAITTDLLSLCRDTSMPDLNASLAPSITDAPSSRFPTTSLSAPARLSNALLTSWLFGNPLFPVINTCSLRFTTNAPFGTVTHHTSPS